MDEERVPVIEAERKKPLMDGEDARFRTTLGLVEEEVLVYVEDYGATTLRGLIRGLGWPSRMVMMAVGALIRERLIRARQHELDVIFEPLTPGRYDTRSDEQVPQVWDG